MKHAYIRYILLFIVMVWANSCTKTMSDKNKIFRYNESKGISILDPAFARNQTIIWPVINIFNGLLQIDSALNIKPCIAHKWELDEQLTTYTFYLRTNVMFHHHPIFGQKQTRKVTSHDFVYSFNRLIDPKTSSPGAWVFNNVDRSFGNNGFLAVNDSILQIKLEQPFVPFLGLLTMAYCSVVPFEIIEQLGDQFGLTPIGTGPFQFKYWELNDRLILTKNKNYFETDNIGNQLPYLEAIHITFIADKQSEFMEFMLGNIDFLSGVHATSKDELLTRSGELRKKHQNQFYLQTTPYLNTEYLGFLMDSSNPHYLPIEIRQAINYSFCRKRMVAFLRNNLAAPALNGFVPPLLYPEGVYPVKGYEYNPEKVSQLLKQAGYEGGKGLKTIILTTTPDYLDIGEYIQHQAAQLGIPIQISTATGGAFRQNVANGKLPFFRASWVADYPHAENFLFIFTGANKSPVGPNYTRFEDKQYDSLYYDIAKYNEKQFLIREADSILIDKSPVVPLFYDIVVRFVNKKVSGFPLNALNNIELKRTKKTG